MKIRRTVEGITEDTGFRVGDIISFELEDGEKAEAMAVKQEGEDMIFCHVDCLIDESMMNSNNSNKGGYEKSYLRKRLQRGVLPRYPEEMRSRMVPFENGDLLRIPTEKEIFGENMYGEEEPETTCQWEPMKLRRNRIAFQGHNGSWEWYWLQNRDVSSGLSFAGGGNNGGANNNGASNSSGVRPVFKIRNL